MSEAEWGDWIEWNGGECPVGPDEPVQLRFSDGVVFAVQSPYSWSWIRFGVGSDIVAYRVKRQTIALPVKDMAGNADERQVGGSHYKDMPVQPWAVMEVVLTPEEFRGYLKGCILKYSMRAGKKEGSDDAGKARHYRQKLEEVMRG